MGNPRFKPQFRRLLHIDQEIRKGTYPNCSSLAEDWEVHPRTIHRDLDYLRDELDAPIEYDAIKHGFYYRDPSWNLQKIVLSEGEVLALLIGSQIAGMFEGTPVGDELTQIYEKLQHLLPDKVALDPAVVLNKFSFVHGPSRKVDPEIWRDMIRAVMQQQVVEILYDSHRAPQSKRHVLHPYHAANIGGEWYIFAHSERWGDIGQYALGRIKSVTTLDRTFQIPAGTDIAKRVAERTGRFVDTSAAKPVNVRLRFDASLADYIAEHTWHPRQTIKMRKDGALDLSFPANNMDGVLSWVLSYAGRVEVLSPAALRTLVSESHALGHKKHAYCPTCKTTRGSSGRVGRAKAQG